MPDGRPCGGKHGRRCTYGMDRRASFEHYSADRPEGDCWRWDGPVTNDGYGQVHAEGKTHSAHRLAYELLVGPIPEDLTIDHLCFTRNCVNPAHLEPVTRGVNSSRRTANHPTCPKGHPFEGATDSNGHRVCVTCRREHSRAANADSQKREQRNARRRGPEYREKANAWQRANRARKRAQP